MIVFKIIISENPDLEVGFVLNRKEAQEFAVRRVLKDYPNLKNLNIDFSTRELRIDERAEVVEKYKRADGQYTYHGSFMSREYIEEEVDKKYQVFIADVTLSE